MQNVSEVSGMWKMSPECGKCLQNVQNVPGVGQISPCAGSLFQVDQFFRWIYVLSGGHRVVIYLFLYENIPLKPVRFN